MTNKIILRQVKEWWYVDEEDNPTETLFSSPSLETVIEVAKHHCMVTGALLEYSPLPFVFNNFIPLHDR